MPDASGGIHRDLVKDGMCGAGHSINGSADVATDAAGVQRCLRCLAEMATERQRVSGRPYRPRRQDVAPGEQPRRHI